MIKSCSEQIEEEGGNEEIVSQFIIKRWKVRCDAHTIYRMILRCYSVNKKRIKSRHYHDDYDGRYEDFHSSSDSNGNSCSSSSSDSSTSILSSQTSSRKSFLSWDSALDMVRDIRSEYDFESGSGYESDSSSDSD
ncbi:MAG: hypothetical protein EZS28_006585 [Streblomastix strix]|uniref:Uncharacterized protein n=1 Tax=Streblomastix strix TaxID=222440 RepID=A0A5J4WSJ4_9EUKA|nr:MAG: hypothetical protein EZS28_006585 [Streblomastix strix]